MFGRILRAAGSLVAGGIVASVLSRVLTPMTDVMQGTTAPSKAPNQSAVVDTFKHVDTWWVGIVFFAVIIYVIYGGYIEGRLGD